MKTFLILIATLFILSGCKKNANTTNSITIEDDGVTYTENSGVTSGSIRVLSNGLNGNFSINIFASASASFPITIHIPVSSTNVLNAYKYTPTFNVPSLIYSNQRVNYTVDSILLNVESVNSFVGNFRMWLSNASGNKEVTGSFNCPNTSLIDL